ncbi:hypothetical protein AYK81_28755 [Bacillus thuringiensis]|nr:hypothetical protein AYK81_28755 [Bacillus thuringiensis]
MNRFKNTIIYKNYEIIINNDFDDTVAQYFNNKLEGNDWSQFQAFISRDAHLYSIVRLPAGDFGKYPSAVKFLRQYEGVNEDILAFLLNKDGDEFSIIMSRKLDKSKHEKIINVFMEKNHIWTNIRFEEQNPKYICNPKIWFYENSASIE